MIIKNFNINIKKLLHFRPKFRGHKYFNMNKIYYNKIYQQIMLKFYKIYLSFSKQNYI